MSSNVANRIHVNQKVFERCLRFLSIYRLAYQCFTNVPSSVSTSASFSSVFRFQRAKNQLSRIIDRSHPAVFMSLLSFVTTFQYLITILFSFMPRFVERLLWKQSSSYLSLLQVSRLQCDEIRCSQKSLLLQITTDYLYTTFFCNKLIASPHVEAFIPDLKARLLETE